MRILILDGTTKDVFDNVAKLNGRVHLVLLQIRTLVKVLAIKSRKIRSRKCRGSTTTKGVMRRV